MAVIETWYNQDLQQPVKVHYLDGSLFSHNGNGNRIGVHVFNNGEPETLSGTVSGYVVTADGTTVPCTGTRSGNSASILIPPAAYQPGAVFITLFITDGTTATTIASVATSVLTARTNNQIDPGSVVTDWTNTINAAMQTVETAAENLGGIIAVPYANITYPVPLGKYTYYEGNLYRCISPIATSESFTAAHWTQVRLGDEVSDLNQAITQIDNAVFTTKGIYDNARITSGYYINSSGAATENPGNSWAITDYMEVDNAASIIYGGLTSVGSSSVNSAWYNADKSVNSVFKQETGSDKSLVVPANAKYVRFSIAIGGGSTDSSTFDCVAVTGIPKENEKDIIQLQGNLLGERSVVPGTAPGLIDCTDGSIVFNQYSYYKEFEITDADKSITFHTSEYSGNYGYAFLNGSGTFISGGQTTETGNKTVDIPANAKTFRVCWKYNETQTITVKYDKLIMNDPVLSSDLYGKVFNIIGDSYVQGAGVPVYQTWHGMVAEKYGMTYNNYGIGGCTMSSVSNGVIDRYMDMADGADFIGVIAGHNDYGNQVPIETFKEATRTVLRGIANKYIGKKVFLVTPWYLDHVDGRPIDITAYIEAEIEVCRECGTPFFDARCSNVYMDNETWRSNFCMLNDGTSTYSKAHLNANGFKIVFNEFEKFMLSL